MIPVSTFNMLIAAVLILTIYSVIDLRNRMYANILTMFLASIVSGYCSAIIWAGIVQNAEGVAVQDTSAGIILFIFCIATMVYAALMVFEARKEAREVD